MRKLKVLMVGSLPPPVGGITVSQSILLKILQDRTDIEVVPVDINAIRRADGLSFRGFLRLLKSVVRKAKHVDLVCVYLATTALPSLGLFLLVVCKVIGRPLIIRKAANLDYFELGLIKGPVSHFVVKRSDLYLAQTKRLVKMARDRGVSHVKWYPTSRIMIGSEEVDNSRMRSCRRFIYVGQVRQYKGIQQIVEAGERFGAEVVVDVYGPLFEDLGNSIFDDCVRVNYCGVLDAAMVVSVLKKYDMLILPTMAKSEGYPGVILEAYSAGLPVITTRCGGIPEIVDESSGIFVEPGSVDGLFDAMKFVVDNDAQFLRLKRGVSAKRSEFDASIWAENFVKFCEQVSAEAR